MDKKIIIVLLCCGLLTACGSSKPSWERKDTPVVTQNDHAVLGVLFSVMILFSLHTFTTK